MLEIRARTHELRVSQAGAIVDGDEGEVSLSTSGLDPAGHSDGLADQIIASGQQFLDTDAVALEQARRNDRHAASAATCAGAEQKTDEERE